MIFGKTKLELKVGVFVFLGMLTLAFFVLNIGSLETWNSGYEAIFSFSFVNGVKMGAPVRFAGVDVGEVKQIEFVFPKDKDKTKVHLHCSIRKGVKIPIDSTVWVNTLGLLGEQYVEIIPGEKYDNILPPDQVLAGQDPIPMHEVAKLAKKIVYDIDESIVKIKNQEGSLGKLIYNDAIYNELEALVTDIRKHPWKLFRMTKDNPQKK